MKKITAFLMSVLLIAGCFSGCNEQIDHSNSGFSSVPTQGESSQEQEDSSSVVHPPVQPEDVVQIRTEEELFAIQEDLAGSYRLMSDITLSKPWQTLGTSDAPFTGVFDGNGYTIRDMEVQSDVMAVDGDSIEYMVGMFGVVRGDVQDLEVDGLHIVVDETTMANTSYATLKAANSKVANLDIHAGLVASNKGNLEDITAKVNINVHPKISIARMRVGGIAGKSNDKIEDCTVTGIISVKSMDGYIRAGGVVGYVSSNGKVKRSGATVDLITEITSAAKTNVGGLIGNIECGIVENCYAKGTIFAVNTADKMTAAGGLIGHIDNADANPKYDDMSVTVTGSYSTVSVTAKGAKAYAAGFIGQIDFGAEVVVMNNACSGSATGDKGSFGFMGRIIRLIGVEVTADDLSADGKFGTLLTVFGNQSVVQDPFATKVDAIPFA